MTDSDNKELRKKLATEKIQRYELEFAGGKYLFIDNKSSITNIIFTGCSQKFYMMISWFNDATDYNYLYLNPNHHNFQNTNMCLELIKSCCLL